MRSPVVASIIHTDLPSDTMHLLSSLLSEAGCEQVQVLSAFPEQIEPDHVYILDERVGGCDVFSFLPKLKGSGAGTCVLVAAPYFDTIMQLKFQRTAPYDPVDIVIIKGEPESQNHIDLSIASTALPAHIRAVFKRMFKSLSSMA